MSTLFKKRLLFEYSQTTVTKEKNTEVPLKRLRLVKKPSLNTSGSTLALLNCIESSKSKSETLRTLLRISDNLEINSEEIPEVVKKLCDYFKNESESSVRVKILALLCDIGLELCSDVLFIIDETILLLKNDTSHKVLAQGMTTIIKLGRLVPQSAHHVHQKLVEVAKYYLKDMTHVVKVKCLEIIAIHAPLRDDESKSILDLIKYYFTHDDARVRSQSFLTIVALHKRGIELDSDIYQDVSKFLKDDYEIVRMVVLELLWILGNSHPDVEIHRAENNEDIRLIDDAFSKICQAVNDLSMQVRTQACKLLGSMKMVSPKFLNQTLDKKLMSNMRRKRTAHELAWENVTSGEWASGKKWADDAPKEVLDANNVSVMNSGACGAFVHGLEDEFLEVRSAAVQSLCQLALNNSSFANLSLDFLVDMFNDEIEDVRLKAIDSLRLISQHIVLRDDQLETILGALEDFSQEIREGLHRMLGTCRISTTYGLKMCVDKLLDNLKKYPNDKRSTYRCLQKIGSCHPHLVMPLVPQLLNIHPFFDTAEPDVENPQYLCLLILVLNAAKYAPTIIPLLEPHVIKHYFYLRDTMATFVPTLNSSDLGGLENTADKLSASESLEFLKNVIKKLDLPDNSLRVQLSLLESAKNHLTCLSEMDSTVSGAAQFSALFIEAQIIFAQLLEKYFWISPVRFMAQQVNNIKSKIQNLLQCCLKLRYFFIGLNSEEKCAVKQFQLKALALNLVLIVKGSNASALAPCHHFLTMVEEMQNDLNELGCEPDNFTAAIFKDLSAMDEPKPGTVCRILIPIISEAKLSKIPWPNVEVKKSSAIILDPTGQNDTSLKFTAGLIMLVPFEAELNNLVDPGRIRIKVKYPDQRTQVILPRPSHMKPLYIDGQKIENESGHNIRLLTSILVSHQVWSEACNIEINLALAIPEADMGRRKHGDSNPTLLDICKAVKVSVAPKPIKKAL